MTGLGDVTQELAPSRPKTAVQVGEEWFGAQPGGRTVVLAVPLSTDMMVAALFTAGQFAVAEEDLADDNEAWGFIGQAIAREGTDAVEELARQLPGLDRAGTLPDARGRPGSDWLEFCRRRVSRLLQP